MKETGGNLASVGFARLLDLIRRKADAAAALDIIREPVKKRFYFKNGLPVAATSNILGEVLGRLLMEEGVITQADYERSLETVLKEKKRHGEVLISMGLLKPDELEMFLSLQLKKRLWKIFSWNEGAYRYTVLPSVPEGISVHPIDTVSLILEGTSLGFYPTARMKENLRDWLDRNITLTEEGRKAIEYLNLNLQEKRFLDSLESGKTLREVLEASDLLRHRALSLVLTYMVAGFIEGTEGPSEVELLEEGPREAPAAEAGGDKRLNAELLFMRARSSVREGDFKAAVEGLEKITELNPREGEYWAYLGWALYNSDPSRAKDGEKIIKDAIDLNNDLDVAWYFLGMITLSQGDIEWGERSLKVALSKNPWMLEALSELKRLELRKKPAPPAEAGKRAELIARLGLAEDPFEAFPAERYILPRTQALETVLKAVRKKSGAVIVTGGAGLGKTTLLLESLKKLSGEKVLASVVLNPPETELKLMRAINAEVGSVIESPSVKEQLLSFGMRVSQNRVQGGHTLVVIDQAHLLTDGCLKLVQYLCRLKSVQIALFAEPSIEERLLAQEFSELATKLSTRLSLEPLTREETGAFILKRVGAAPLRQGFVAAPFALKEDALEAVYAATRGVPGLIIEKAADTLAPPVKKAAEAKVVEAPKTVISEKAEEEPFAEVTKENREALVSPPPIEARKAVERAGVKRRPEAAAIPSPEVVPEKKPKRGVLRLLLWVLAMLILGLLAGSLIGIYWFNRTAELPGNPIIINPNSPAPPEVPETGQGGPVEADTGLKGPGAPREPVSASSDVELK